MKNLRNLIIKNIFVSVLNQRRSNMSKQLIASVLSFLVSSIYSQSQVFDPRPDMTSNCVRIDPFMCIGNNTFIQGSSFRDQDTQTFAFYNFENDMGIDVSRNGSNNFVFSQLLLQKLLPSFQGKSVLIVSYFSRVWVFIRAQWRRLPRN